jgi:hypothetical protein
LKKIYDSTSRSKQQKNFEEAIAEFINVIQKAPGAQHQTTNLKLNIRNTHGKSRKKLSKNKSSEEDCRRVGIQKINADTMKRLEN